MKCRKNYKDQEKYRVYRNNCNKKYYKSRVFYGKNHKRYSEEEVEMIINKVLPDTELAQLLGRSVMAIQAKRHIEKRKEENEDNA